MHYPSSSEGWLAGVPIFSFFFFRFMLMYIYPGALGFWHACMDMEYVFSLIFFSSSFSFFSLFIM